VIDNQTIYVDWMKKALPYLLLKIKSAQGFHALIATSAFTLRGKQMK
jgi:hypothetical protein